MKSEMEWSKLFYSRRAELWERRATELALTKPDLRYYAHRQAWTWTLLRTQVEHAIQESSGSIPQPVK